MESHFDTEAQGDWVPRLAHSTGWLWFRRCLPVLFTVAYWASSLCSGSSCPPTFNEGLPEDRELCLFLV